MRLDRLAMSDSVSALLHEYRREIEWLRAENERLKADNARLERLRIGLQRLAAQADDPTQTLQSLARAVLEEARRR